MLSPMLETIVVTVRPSGVCLIEFNRPHRGNAFNALVSKVSLTLTFAYSLGMEYGTEVGHR